MDASWVFDVQSPSSTSIYRSIVTYNMTTLSSSSCRYETKLLPNLPDFPSFSAILTSSCPDTISITLLPSTTEPTGSPLDDELSLAFSFSHTFDIFHSNSTFSDGFPIDVVVLGNSKVFITTVLNSSPFFIMGDRVIPPMFPYSKKRMIIPWVIFLVFFVGIHIVLRKVQLRMNLAEEERRRAEEVQSEE
ncbi:hypothetical protein GEMRC1_007560 [Eukaryota sp. GEM-RC1]